jgi:small subunit ribosomal protein S25e
LVAERELTTERHLQQLEARSRRRSGPRERVCDPVIYASHPPPHSRTRTVAISWLFSAACTPRPPTPTWNTSNEWPLTRSIVKDKAQHAVVLDKQTNDRLQKEVQSYRLITVATLVDRLKINGSLARQALADLEEQGTIKKVVGHSKLSVYST